MLSRFIRRRRAGPRSPGSEDSASPRRTSSYPENTLNLASFYTSYLVLLASAVLVAFFSLQPSTSFIQTISVQPLPNLVFVLNSDPAATTLPSEGSGGKATCTPDYWYRGTRIEYDCTSTAANGEESLRFTLYTTTPFPAKPTYRPKTLKWPDIEVGSYGLSYYTYIPDATATSPSSSAAAVATPTPPPSESLSLRSIEYPSSSLSALQAGTFISTLPPPSPTTTSITVYTAKLKEGTYVYFTVVAVMTAVLASMTVGLVSFNLAVASRKVYPEESEQITHEGLKEGHGAVATQEADTTTRRVALDGRSMVSTLPMYQRFRAAQSSRTLQIQDAAPPAYQEHPDGAATSSPTLATSIPHTEDLIEEIFPTAVPTMEEVHTPKISPPRSTGPSTSVNGRRLSLPQSWLILPSYAYLYLWDMLPFLPLLILLITAVGLLIDPMLDLHRFLSSGACLAPPASKDSVYDLQRLVCGGGKFLSAYPFAYSDPSPKATLGNVARDLVIVLVALGALFISYLAWTVGLLRKNTLTRRDGYEPEGVDGERRYTGRTREGYVAVCETVGSHR